MVIVVIENGYFIRRLKKWFIVIIVFSFLKNNGYDDWRNLQKFLENHAKKGYHVLAISMYLNRTKLSGRIDSELEKQLTETCDYWKNMLRRIIETILFLSGRGLPFRGSDEHFGSNHNGNYLGILEILSKFSPTYRCTRKSRKRTHILFVQNYL